MEVQNLRCSPDIQYVLLGYPLYDIRGQARNRLTHVISLTDAPLHRGICIQRERAMSLQPFIMHTVDRSLASPHSAHHLLAVEIAERCKSFTALAAF